MQPKPGASPNPNPIHVADPTPERSTKNGKAFKAGPDGYEFWVVHVYGTPYEMGYAHGSMMKKEVQTMADSVWQYFEKQIEDELNGLPTWLKDWVAEVGIELATNLTWELTKNFTGDYFFEELHGTYWIGFLTGVLLCELGIDSCFCQDWLMERASTT